jgi:hypothetical protein
MSGRLWKAESGECHADGSSQMFRPWGSEVRLLFENFTRPGASCDALLAVFFLNHAMTYVAFTDGPAPWDQLPDWLMVDGPPAPALAVPVHVWIGGSGAVADDLRTLAQADIAVANDLFRESRTGIHLTADYQLGLPSGITNCAVNSPVSSSGINVYYVPATDPLHARTQNRDGAWCRHGGTDYVTIATGTLHSGTALSHYLGHALGLSDATTADGFTSTNVMWDQGTGTRGEFTLGQVFRMNVDPESWLNVSASSPRTSGPTFDCDAAESAKCPKTTATAP